MPANHKIGRREIGGRQTRRDELRQNQVRRIDRRRIAKFERGLAYAGALMGEVFHQFLMDAGKGSGRRGKNFENSRKLLGVVGVKYRDRQDRADAEALGDVGIDSRVALGIDRELGFTALQAGAGEAVARLQWDAETWG